MAKNLKKLKYFIIVILAFITLSVWITYFSQPDEKVNLYFFDVGQGDSQLIQKGSWQILIDGGPDDSVIEKISSVMPLDDRKIEEIIITHPHTDHISGLNEIIERYKIGKIVLTGVEYESEVYKNLLRLIENKKIPTTTPKKLDVEYVFDKGKITYLWPEDDIGLTEKNINNTSIVFLFEYGKFTSLMTGDAEIDSWQKIINNNKSLIEGIIAVKIPHHGSRTGFNEEVIKIVDPKITIMSLGANNKFGFPHKEIVDLLSTIDSQNYRTDLDKDINLSTDGDNWQIKTAH